MGTATWTGFVPLF